ncbi:4Fe-4S dicluster domain-containing protein [Myxococcota bacterium]|nr:4Fe-4S dicluster domain-containing protein [Myxococcota bacterium]MCZ7620472.1 4Fe-4S dicluster domain-containing protein [Myxococcota bacterium]
MSLSRRALLTGHLDDAPDTRGFADRIRRLFGVETQGSDPPPAPSRASIDASELPPEVAAHAARFEAELGARPRATPSGALPGPVAWLLAPSQDDDATSGPLLRPPGAIEELAFRAGCTRCGDCARACPHGAIRLASERVAGAAGTPLVQPEWQACLMCVDKPCIAACPPRVLRADLPARIGLAVAKPQSCFNQIGGSTCTVCAERCPVPGALRIETGKVRIDAAACTGCGVCVYACPAPSRALVVLPLATRPAAPERVP